MNIARGIRSGLQWPGLMVLVMALALGGCFGGGGGSDDVVDDGAGDAGGIVGTDNNTPIDDALVADILAGDEAAIDGDINLAGTVQYDADSGEMSVHFRLCRSEPCTDASTDGISLTNNPLELRFYVSELVNDPTGDVDPGPAWNQLLSERGTPGSDDPEDALPGTLEIGDGTDGEYTYTFAETIPASDNLHRVTVRARWRDSDTRINIVLPENESYDFMQSDPATPLDASGADMVTTAACEGCHGDRIGYVGHGGGYNEVKTCNHCHNVNYMADRSLEADLAHMVHRIHEAQMFDELTDHGEAVDFSGLTYPQHTFTCETCHSDEAPNASLAFSNPTRRNCGGCHTEVDFTGSPGDGEVLHTAGAFDNDDACGTCHTPSEGNFAGVANGHPFSAMHNPLDVDPADLNTDADVEAGTPKDPRNVPEFDVTVALSEPANGEFFVEGEAPVVMVTVSPTDGGADVDFDQAGDGNHDRDGNLESAVYGVYARDGARPVLSPGSCTDGGNAQRPSFFNTDPEVNPVGPNQVEIQLAAIPAIGTDLHADCGAGATFEAGTYVVRVEMEDYGAASGDDYVTASSAFTTFQIGTAEETSKVSGDACVQCHGDTRMHLAGAHPHNAGFDTDECLMCHDKSNNYGEYIGNRVHAVHSASLTGDLHDRDWTHVTYPQDPNNCTTCHTNPDADPPVWETIVPFACAGCHGADSTSDHVNVSGDGTEGEAAGHMIAQGAPNDGTSVTDTDPDLDYGCSACHGPGSPFEELRLINVHGLINFGVTTDE